jgi:hypothetical protein
MTVSGEGCSKEAAKRWLLCGGVVLLEMCFLRLPGSGGQTTARGLNKVSSVAQLASYRVSTCEHVLSCYRAKQLFC